MNMLILYMVQKTHTRGGCMVYSFASNSGSTSSVGSASSRAPYHMPGTFLFIARLRPAPVRVFFLSGTDGLARAEPRCRPTRSVPFLSFSFVFRAMCSWTPAGAAADQRKVTSLYHAPPTDRHVAPANCRHCGARSAPGVPDWVRQTAKQRLAPALP